MSPQLTLQTPLQLPPEEIPSYLDQLWSTDQATNTGSNTFCLLIWQPAWIEQELARTGKINGPIIGTIKNKIVNAARQVVIENQLPLNTYPFDLSVKQSLSKMKGVEKNEDLRGQNIDSSISLLQPRRLITFAPTIEDNHPLETLVAAYCPLNEEGNGNRACGDVVVLRGGVQSLNQGIDILKNLLPQDLPSWLWWNGSLDESNELFSTLSPPTRRLICDSSLGNPLNCLTILQERIEEDQVVNDLNWLRLRNWRESLAMVFDPPERRLALNSIIRIDIDVQGENPVQGLLLGAWIADRLGWQLIKATAIKDEYIDAQFKREDSQLIDFRLISLPIGNPSIYPGEVVGVRLISKFINNPKKDLCVILASESGECMRLEAGGMANMELLEQVVPNQNNSLEKDVARLLASSRGNTSPLLAAAAPLANEILNQSLTNK